MKREGEKMREVEFKMERPGQVEVGQMVEISEYLSANYYYIIKPAVAMSGCYKVNERIKNTSGVVKEIRKTDKGHYVVVEFDE